MKASVLLKDLRASLLAIALASGCMAMPAQHIRPGAGIAPAKPVGVVRPVAKPAPVRPAPRPVASPVVTRPAYWAHPWYTGISPMPRMMAVPVATAASVGAFQNAGTEKVVACGYDAQGVWQVLPLLVSYHYNGVQYDVTVINAWNPWTNQWDMGVDTQAFITSYYIRNVCYDYYVVLPYGTFYFNL